MTPAQHNISMTQGDTFIEQYRFVGYDFTSYSAKMQWRDQNDALKITADTLNSTMTITHDGSDTIFVPIITATQTGLLAPGYYSYDFQLASPNGIVETYLSGTVHLLKGITV